MDNTNTEVKHNLSIRSPPRRRRSTFFERRDSLVLQPVAENIEPSKCLDETENEKRLKEISSYYKKLLAENVDWKSEAIERRNKYHDLKQQYEMATKSSSTSRISYSTLTNEDINFLKGKPNLNNLYEAQQKLHESVKETVAIMRRASELDEVLMSYCEVKVQEITDYILENSTVEPVKSD